MKCHTFYLKSLYTGIITALVASSSLMAQDFKKYNGSFQIGYAKAMGNLSDGTNSGFNLALAVERSWSVGFATRGRLDWVSFNEKDDDSDSKTGATILMASLDLLGRTPKGAYFFVAPGFASVSLKTPAFTAQQSGSKTSPAVSGGLGWMSRDSRLTAGFEVKYTKLLGFKPGDKDFNCDWTAISLLMRW
ncbi:MAG: outer membrane beta-barrel protein [Holophagaceae bacterium]|nr:outer membrane beta-barrel protein [Holophagaceae bacterium]